MWRLRGLLLFFYIWFFLITARLFQWQVLSNSHFRDKALKQQIMRTEVIPRRGEILAHDGSPIVANQAAYVVYAEPKLLESPLDVSKQLSVPLKMEEASIAALLQSNLYWVPIKRKVEQEFVDQIKKLNVKGIGMEREDKRFYPEGSMSAHLVGFVGSTYDGTDEGYFGLEGYYDRELKGRTGFLQQSRSALGNPILAGETREIEPENGSALKLHLDRTMQFIAERKLLEGIEQFGAKGGSVIIMDPKDGGIKAIASYPSYDPAIYDQFPAEYYRNPVVADTYEPGSTFKVLVMAAAINEGVVKPDTVFEEPGPLPVGGYKIRTWNNEYSGTLTATQVLERSSNVGMVHVGNKLGGDRLVSYIKAFGFGEKTQIDLAEESSPGLREDWQEIDLATLTFGQGIAVTPIQMIRAVAAIANGGTLYEPQMVDSVVSPWKEVYDIKPKIVREVLKPTTAKIVTEMMVSAVDHGEAKYKKPAGYRVAGKTGTAQIPVEGHYDATKTIASFVGFAPADDPQFIMLVRIQEPTSSPWGSETAAPLFFGIAKELFSYLHIAPSY